MGGDDANDGVWATIAVNTTGEGQVRNRFGLIADEAKDSYCDLDATSAGFNNRPACGLYHMSVYRQFENGIMNWLMSLGEAIALADGDVFLVKESIYECDSVDDESTNVVKGVACPEMETTPEPGCGCNHVSATNYQKFQLTVLAGGVYTAGKMIELLVIYMFFLPVGKLRD